MSIIKRILREWLFSDQDNPTTAIPTAVGGSTGMVGGSIGSFHMGNLPSFIMAVHKASNGYILEYRIVNPNGPDKVTHTILPFEGDLTQAITTALVQGVLSK